MNTPALSHRPPVKLYRLSQRVYFWLGTAEPLPAVRQAMQRLAHHGLMFEGMLTWSLIVAEVGTDRLPGGVLVREPTAAMDPGTFLGPDLSPQPWHRCVEATVYAAAKRDGAGVIAEVTRSVELLDPEAALSYAASLAYSAGWAMYEARVDRVDCAMLHLIGHHADYPERFAVAGQCWRIARALHACTLYDPTGPQALAAELGALARFDLSLLLGAINVAARSFLTLVDDPGDLLTPVQSLDLDGRQQRVIDWQAVDLVDCTPGERAVAHAMRLALAFARHDTAQVRSIVRGFTEPRVDLGLAVFGLLSLLASRAAQVWADGGPGFEPGG